MYLLAYFSFKQKITKFFAFKKLLNHKSGIDIVFLEEISYKQDFTDNRILGTEMSHNII